MDKAHPLPTLMVVELLDMNIFFWRENDKEVFSSRGPSISDSIDMGIVVNIGRRGFECVKAYDLFIYESERGYE